MSTDHPADPAPLRAALALPEALLSPADLEQALTHRSYAYEHGGLPTNERLEFLGDAVLGLVVADALFRDHPEWAEGQLAKTRASVVNMHALADIARGVDLGAHLRLGRGEEATGGRDKPSILADALEALLGATYSAAGLAPAAALVHRLFDPLLGDALALRAGLDWKTSLQELAAARSGAVPVYAVAQTGPDHARHFTATVAFAAETAGGQAVGAAVGPVLGSGEGGTKKQAEQRAAQQAFRVLSADAGA